MHALLTCCSPAAATTRTPLTCPPACLSACPCFQFLTAQGRDGALQGGAEGAPRDGQAPARAREAVGEQQGQPRGHLARLHEERRHERRRPHQAAQAEDARRGAHVRAAAGGRAAPAAAAQACRAQEALRAVLLRVECCPLGSGYICAAAAAAHHIRSRWMARTLAAAAMQCGSSGRRRLSLQGPRSTEGVVWCGWW